MPAKPCNGYCNPVAQVSSHYFVFENGHALQLVPEGRRAWHAGASHWAGETDINSCSIGIEIANPGHPGGSAPISRRSSSRRRSSSAATSASAGRSRRSACSPIPTSRPAARSTPARTPWRRFAEGGVGLWTRARPDPRRALLRPRRERPAGRGPAGDVRHARLRRHGRRRL